MAESTKPVAPPGFVYEANRSNDDRSGDWVLVKQLHPSDGPDPGDVSVVSRELGEQPVSADFTTYEARKERMMYESAYNRVPPAAVPIGSHILEDRSNGA